MKKENVFVRVDSFDQFEKFRNVLNSLGLKIWGGYGGVGFDKYMRFDYHNRLGMHSTNLGFEKITFGQLIDLLNEPKKIAVKVENEKEFNALMKYYDSMGWKHDNGVSAMECNYGSHNNFVYLHDNFWFASTCGYVDKEGYQIITFSEFAEQHGIKLPLLTSDDGFDLYDGDAAFPVKDNEIINQCDYVVTKQTHNGISRGYKYFSTKQAALEWIEAQKPKETVLQFGAYKFTVKKDSVNVSHGDSDTFVDINSIYKAFLELN